MEPKKADKPVAMCPLCHLVAHDSGRIGNRCSSKSGNYRCDGIFTSTSEKNDWAECARCGATGMVEGIPCRHCRGVGWLFVRPGGFDNLQPAGMPIIGHTQ